MKPNIKIELVKHFPYRQRLLKGLTMPRELFRWLEKELKLNDNHHVAVVKFTDNFRTYVNTFWFSDDFVIVGKEEDLVKGDCARD